MNTETVNWAVFKQKLINNPDLDLQFQYAGAKWVLPCYHITEIKQAPITSVDCGGLKNEWTEIIVQLMEPSNTQQSRAMKVRKALAIIDVVEKVLPLDDAATIKIEFGNADFDTRHLYPAKFITDGENLVIDLQPDFVQCKAVEHCNSCGPVKQKVELKNLSATACCTPGSECC